jgi:hypothetical protein
VSHHSSGRCDLVIIGLVVRRIMGLAIYEIFRDAGFSYVNCVNPPLVGASAKGQVDGRSAGRRFRARGAAGRR